MCEPTVELNRVTVRWNRQSATPLICATPLTCGGGGIAGENGASIEIRESVLTSNYAAVNGNQMYVSASAQQGASITLVNTRLPPPDSRVANDFVFYNESANSVGNFHAALQFCSSSPCSTFL